MIILSWQVLANCEQYKSSISEFDTENQSSTRCIYFALITWFFSTLNVWILAKMETSFLKKSASINPLLLFMVKRFHLAISFTTLVCSWKFSKAFCAPKHFTELHCLQTNIVYELILFQQLLSEETFHLRSYFIIPFLFEVLSFNKISVIIRWYDVCDEYWYIQAKNLFSKYISWTCYLLF